MAAKTSDKVCPSRLHVAAVQMKFARTIDGNLRKIERFADQGARRGADVVLLPECAVTGYGYDFATLRPGQLRDALESVSAIARQHRLNLLVGTPVFARRKLYNCLVHFDREGRAVYCYAKCHLTDMDRQWFTPGNAVALFAVDGVPVTTVICHERRYPELVRLAVMAGAQILFHPNAGMDPLAISRAKRGGRDGIAVRAFENAIYYVFANSVGPQGGGKFSAGDSKIVAPDERVLQLADNQHEALLDAELDLGLASRVYPLRALSRPKFLAPHWRKMLQAVRRQAAAATALFDLPK
jgi:predicted amidohydrolase